MLRQEQIIAWPINVGDSQNLWSERYSIQLLSVLSHLVIGQFNLRSVFLCFSLVTINQQTSYYSDNLRQDYGILRGLLMDHTRFIRVVQLPKRAGLFAASDQTVRAMHSCNSWFVMKPGIK